MESSIPGDRVDNELLDGFYLNAYRVEPLTGAVDVDGVSAHLPSKAMEVLLALAKNPRRLVTRHDLLAKVWGDGHGSNETLNHAVSEIRQVLGDHADDPAYIQTVPKRGYRLLIEPRLEIDQSSPYDAHGSSSNFWDALIRHGVVQASVAYLVAGWLLIQVADTTFENIGLPAWAMQFVTFAVIGGFPVVVLLAWFLEFAEGRMVRDEGTQPGGLLQGLQRNYLAIIAAYGIAAVGAGVYQATVGFTPPDTGTDQAEEELVPIADNSLAVLRLVSIDGDERAQVFSNGLSEDILDGLARLPGLFVASRGDAWSLPPNAPSDLVRRRLRVAYFLEGSVRFTNANRLRVVVQLIDSRTGFHIFSRGFEHELDEFGELQNEITSVVVANLRVALDEQIDGVELPPARTANMDAYYLYRQGLEAMYEAYTPGNLERAVGFFDEALRIDPGYPAAHAGRCRAYTGLHDLQRGDVNIALAEASCAAALDQGPRLAVVQNAVGQFYKATGELTRARQMFEQVLAENPQDVIATLGLAELDLRDQRLDEAEAHFKRVAEFQPGNPETERALGDMYFRTGRFSEAIAEYRRAIFIDPNNYNALRNLGSATLMTGEFEVAREAIEKVVEIKPDAIALSNLAIVYYYLGDYEASLKIHEASIEMTPDVHTPWLNLADSLYFAGREDEAVDAYLRAAVLAELQLDVDSQDAEALTALAWAKAKTGSVEDGLNYARRALELNPADPYSHYFLALVLLENGDRESAVDSLEQALLTGFPAAMLAAEPHLQSLKSDIRFTSLLTSGDKRGEQ